MDKHDWKEALICAVLWGMFGFCGMSGMKAADWLIPSPPGTTIKVEIHQDGTEKTTGKRPYIIG